MWLWIFGTIGALGAFYNLVWLPHLAGPERVHAVQQQVVQQQIAGPPVPRHYKGMIAMTAQEQAALQREMSRKVAAYDFSDYVMPDGTVIPVHFQQTGICPKTGKPLGRVQMNVSIYPASGIKKP